MAVSDSKYRKSQRALQFLSDNADEARDELGEEEYERYIGAFKKVIGKYESEQAQGLIGGGVPITEEWRKGAREERDVAVREPPPRVAPLKVAGKPLGAGRKAVAGAAGRVAPKTGEAAVKGMVEEAVGEAPGAEELEGAAVPLDQLISERTKAEEIRGAQYDESLPIASKLKELDTPPEFIGEGPVNQRSMWFEPTLEEFHEDMKEVLGDQVLRYDEGSDAYKEYSDQRWREAYEHAKKENRTLMRVDYSPSTTGGPFDWKNKLAHAQDVLYAGAAGIDRGLLLGGGAALSELITPGAAKKIEATEARHPIASGVGLAGSVMSPSAVANLAARGAAAAGRALAPGAAKLLRGAPVLGGAAVGAAAGAVGAGTQVAGEELVEQAAGLAPPDVPGALRRGGEAAGIGGLVGGGAGALLGGATRLQERVRRGRMGTDLRRAEAPEVGGRTSVMSGFKAGKPVREVRERAIRAGKPVEEGGQGVYPAPSAEGQLAGEVAEDVRRFGAGKTAEFREAEEALTEDLRGLAERRFRDYQEQLERAAGDITEYAQERTWRYRIREHEAGKRTGEYAERRLGELEATERGLAEELSAYGAEASREYDGLIDSLTESTLKGARRFTEEQKKRAGELVGKYYASPEGLRTRDTKPVIEAFDEALKKMTDARGNPLINRERATQDVQGQARLLFKENTIRVVDSPQEAEALARKISSDNTKRPRGDFGDAEVLTVPQARRFGLGFDEAANVGDEATARIVVERRRLNAKAMDAYLYGYRDWASANSAKGIKHRETAGVEPAIHRAREQSPGFSDVKGQAAELAATAERTEKAVGIRRGRVGQEDIDTERAVRGVIEETPEGAPSPELERLVGREGTAEQLAAAKRAKREAADVGLDLPLPEPATQQRVEGLRGKVRRALTLENPSLERVLERRGRLGEFRGLQAGRRQAAELGLGEDVAGASRAGKKLVREYARGEPNVQLEDIARDEGWLQTLREIPAIREEMAVLGLAPEVAEMPQAAFEERVRSLLQRFARDELTPNMAEQLRGVLGTRGFNSALLPMAKREFAELGLPEGVGDKFLPEQAAVVKRLLNEYSKGTMPDVQRKALTRNLWRTRPGAAADLDRFPRLREELAAVGLKPDVGETLTPEQVAKIKSILQRYAAGAPNEALERAVGPALPKLRLLPGLRSTERLEEAGRPHLRASQSSLWASVPTLAPLTLRADAAARHLRKIRPSAAAATETERRKERRGGSVSESGKKKLKKLRLGLDPALRRL